MRELNPCLWFTTNISSFFYKLSICSPLKRAHLACQSTELRRLYAFCPLWVSFTTSCLWELKWTKPCLYRATSSSRRASVILSCCGMFSQGSLVLEGAPCQAWRVGWIWRGLRSTCVSACPCQILGFRPQLCARCSHLVWNCGTAGILVPPSKGILSRLPPLRSSERQEGQAGLVKSKGMKE